VKLGDWIAVLALFFASVNTFVQWQLYKDKRRRRLRVQPLIRTRTNTTRLGAPPEEVTLQIDVINESQTAITISKIYSRAEPVLYKREYLREEVQGKNPLPHTLTPAAIAVFWLPWEKVYGRSPDADGWVRFIIGVEDESKKVYEHAVEYHKRFDAGLQ
jgi:hypothetical protein